MSARDLDAAGITDSRLRESYERCRALNAAHGRTYYLATLLLPRAKRPFVHALYGFARHADEIVDAKDRDDELAATRLQRFADGFLKSLDAGVSHDPVAAAVVDTALRWGLDRRDFQDFLRSMEMDLTVGEYATWDDLQTYVHGSAAVIGRQLVPILGSTDAAAYGYAEDLGAAFQLANFLRDVGEDLDRGRLYLPLADLERFGLTRADLERRVVDERVRDLLRFEIARVRRLADRSRAGDALLDPTSRPCIAAARTLYCGIVDEIEAIDFQVFDRRAATSPLRRVRVAAPAWVSATRARRRANVAVLPPAPAGPPAAPTTPSSPA